MRENIIIGLAVYLTAMNILGGVLAAIDKAFAIKKHYRISERTLMLTGLFGGAAGTYAVMKAIRHKTRHMKFMVGLPLMIFLHIVIIFLCFRFF